MRRHKKRERELAEKKKAVEAERIVNETQEEPDGMITPAPKARRPTPTPPPTDDICNKEVHISTTNRADPYHIEDDYPSQVSPIQDDEVVVDSLPLQRTQARLGLTDSNHTHNMFDKSQGDLGYRFLSHA